MWLGVCDLIIWSSGLCWENGRICNKNQALVPKFYGRIWIQQINQGWPFGRNYITKKNGFSDILKDSIIRSNAFNSFLLLCLVWYFAWIPIKKKKKLNCAIYRKWIVLYAFDWWTGACIYEWELFYGEKLCKCNSEPRMNSLYYQLWYLANEIWLKLYFLFPQEWMDGRRTWVQNSLILFLTHQWKHCDIL